jgi:chromosome segregation protein
LQRLRLHDPPSDGLPFGDLGRQGFPQRAEGRLEAARERLEACTRAIPERLEMSIEELAEAVVQYGDLPEVRECEKQLETLKADREKLGAVNLRAEEELVELEEKQGALVTEREILSF